MRRALPPIVSGASYGRLTVIAEAPRSERCKHRRWLCRCSCGRETIVWQTALKTGHTLSCGCLHMDACRSHGCSRAGNYIPEYGVWIGMMNRCRNRKMDNWRLYGGRGISVCDRWHSFENFLADMGPRPDGMTIDRINSDGNYEPGNCRWASRTVQNQNQARIRKITVGSESLCVSEWARRTGQSFASLYYRATHGWTDSEIVIGRKHAQ